MSAGMKHDGYTKGPWTWGESERGCEALLSGIKDKYVIDSADYEGMWFSAYDASQDEANKKLVADAPRLYEENVVLHARVKELETKSDSEMERVKACEHIAEGDEGWQKLTDLCPSIAAVARLRRLYERRGESNNALGKQLDDARISEQEVLEANRGLLARLSALETGLGEVIPVIDRNLKEDMVAGSPYHTTVSAIRERARALLATKVVK